MSTRSERTPAPPRSTPDRDPAFVVEIPFPNQLIRLALRRAGITLAEAARDMALTETQFCEQLENRDGQHVSWLRLFGLSDRFWRELWLLVIEHRGFARLGGTPIVVVEEGGPRGGSSVSL